MRNTDPHVMKVPNLITTKGSLMNHSGPHPETNRGLTLDLPLTLA